MLSKLILAVLSAKAQNLIVSEEFEKMIAVQRLNEFQNDILDIFEGVNFNSLFEKT